MRTLVGIAAVVLAIGCGSSAKSNNAVCRDADAPDECGTDCTGNTDCPAGFYCGNSGCSADCQSNADCSDGKVCNSRGECVDAEVQPDADCPSVTARAEPQTPTVLLLIDQSGSMTEDFDDPDGNDSTRWTELHRALTNLGNGGGVVDNLQASVVFGATLYTGDDGNNSPECPILVKVPATLNNADAIDDAIDDNDPADDTPTAEALTVSYMTFPDTVTPTSPRVLILATDGDPDSCEDPDSNGEQGPRDASEMAVAAGFDMGIQTYVLSVGDDATESHLNHLARLGVGQDPETGSAQAYIATDATALQEAFDEIINGTRSCIFDLDGQITLDGAEQGDVELNGNPLEFGSDWQLSGDMAIELIGEACTSYLDTPNADLTAEFPCGGFIVQ